MPASLCHCMMNTGYCGRFAPSPTGPLHFGSLVAATGSYLDARASHGRWLVRMEDLDPPREVPGAADGILRTLERFQLCWDEDVVYQSHRHEAYYNAAEILRERRLAFPCACSRREAGDIYPGTCRHGLPAGKKARSLRIGVDNASIRFSDLLQGDVIENLGEQVGDFVIQRADGLFAYQLAVVVDDAWQGITHVVRGSDLLSSTARQIYLQQCLDYQQPQYLHLPLAVNSQGEKLGKQTQAPGVDQLEPVATLRRVLRFLGQPVPEEHRFGQPGALLDWAARRWDRHRLPRGAAAIVVKD